MIEISEGEVGYFYAFANFSNSNICLETELIVVIRCFLA